MRFRKKNLVFYGIITLLLLYILFFDSNSYLRLYKTKQKLAEAQQNLTELMKENDRLRAENEQLENNRQIWEMKARELGMQKDGDEVYIFKKGEN